MSNQQLMQLFQDIWFTCVGYNICLVLNDASYKQAVGYPITYRDYFEYAVGIMIGPITTLFSVITLMTAKEEDFY